MQGNAGRARARISTQEYAKLAAFRFALRAFLHFSEEAAAQVGLTGQHYQALLILRARAGSEAVTINELAQQLFLKHNSAVELADRLESEGLIVRAPSRIDRRKVELHMTPRGSRLITRLAARHRAELRRIGPQIEAFFHELSGGDAAGEAGEAGEAAPRLRKVK